MSQSESEQQLRIWKDLAINKQMIMNEAASALKLKGEWTQDELKEALDTAIRRANDADMAIARSRAETEIKLAEMSDKMRTSDKARLEAEERIATAKEAQDTAERQLTNGRKENSDALRKAKGQIEERQRELKAINTALADTPDNVVKKLKNLKRQKHEEATGRSKAEDLNRKLKKENKEHEEALKKYETLSEDSSKLLENYREVRSHCEVLQDKLKSSDTEFDTMADVDHDLLGRIEKATAEPAEA